MKRYLALLLVLAACPAAEPVPLPGNVRQPAGAVIVGSRLFVSALAEDALRVAELRVDAADRFERAPNPLFALHIPVVRRPSALATLEVEGTRPLVAALSSVDPQVRLVDAAALAPLGAPVALTGRPVAAVGERSEGVFWVLIEEEGGGALLELVLTAAARDPAGTVGAQEAPAQIGRVFSLAGVVPGGLALTTASGQPEAWVSDLAGEDVRRVDLETGAVVTVPVGLTLSLLTASPSVESSTVPLPSGAYVYGLTADGRGVLALDVRTGAVAEEQVFREVLLPILLPSDGVGLIAVSRLTVSASQAQGGILLPGLVQILLIVPLVDGSVLFADGIRMVPLDRDGDLKPDPTLTMTPAVVESVDGAPTAEIDRSAPVLAYRSNPRWTEGGTQPRYIPDVDLNAGVTRSRTWVVGYRVALPEQEEVAARLSVAGAEVAVVPASAPDNLAEVVQPLDEVVIDAWYEESPPEGCEAYAGAAALSYVAERVEDGRIFLAPGDGPPLPSAACFPTAFVYTVRAAGYTVTGTDLDTVFRLQPGERFVHEGERFARSSPLIIAPELRFTLLAEQDEAQMTPGATRVLSVSSGLEPDLFSPITAVRDLNASRSGQLLAALPTPSMPGLPAVWRDPAVPTRARVYVPYAGSGYVLSFSVLNRGNPGVLY